MKAQLTITLDDVGNVNVSGPINDKVLAYGLLEYARDAIQKFHEQQQNKVLTAPASALSQLVGAH